MAQRLESSDDLVGDLAVEDDHSEAECPDETDRRVEKPPHGVIIGWDTYSLESLQPLSDPRQREIWTVLRACLS